MQSGAELPGHSALFILHSALRWWAREDLHLQGSQTLDLWGLLFPPNHSPENGLPSRSSAERRLVLPAGISPATTAFGGLRSNT
jgi:hypothetical protein